MSKTLVIRMSALGDVAMLIPVLYSCAKKYPEEEFLLLTKKPLIPLFQYKPSNVQVLGLNTKDEYKGFRGVVKIIKELSTLNIRRIADLHDVLRSKLICYYFKIKGSKIAVFDKDRENKRLLISRENKKLFPLRSSIEKYHDVFLKLGYDFNLDFSTIFEYGPRDIGLIRPITGEKTGVWIGIAPFAKHQGKIYPAEKMKQVINQLVSVSGMKIFLFGGKDEADLLKELSSHPQVVSVAGKLTFPTELLLMSDLDVMITMDSGNMHLASLVETPVVSVWGATHPYAGFYGYKQDLNNIVQAELFCRPCSIYGNKPCYRGNYECMELINPEIIVSKVLGIIDKNT